MYRSVLSPFFPIFFHSVTSVNLQNPPQNTLSKTRSNRWYFGKLLQQPNVQNTTVRMSCHCTVQSTSRTATRSSWWSSWLPESGLSSSYLPSWHCATGNRHLQTTAHFGISQPFSSFGHNLSAQFFCENLVNVWLIVKIIVRIWSNLGQNLVKLGSLLVNLGSKVGQIWIKICSNMDQTLV